MTDKAQEPAQISTRSWQDIRRTLAPEREARIKAKVEAELSKLPPTDGADTTD